MIDKDENKFERLASHFHCGDDDSLQGEIRDDKDFEAVERIYSQRDKVNLLARFSRTEEAKKKLDRRLRGQNGFFKAGNVRLFRYAAAFFVFAVLSGTLGRMIYRSLLSEEKEIITERSATGEIKEVELPDGTKVWLGANSTLRYDSQFGQKNRQVVFEGEAMFDVTKNEALSFRVNIENASVTVHGTKFLVTSFSGAHKNELVLLEGKVRYRQEDHALFILPGEQLTHNRLTGGITLDQVDVANYREWTKGKIILEKKELEDLAFLMAQWYGTKFVFRNDSLRTYRFTGTINKEKPLDYNLSIISLTNKVKFKRERNEIIITN